MSGFLEVDLLELDEVSGGDVLLGRGVLLFSYQLYRGRLLHDRLHFFLRKYKRLGSFTLGIVKYISCEYYVHWIKIEK